MSLSDLGDPEARAVDFRSGEALFSLVVVRRGEKVVAYENDCPHARQPMERPDGRVVLIERRYLVCSAHGASFRIEDGHCVGGPAKGAPIRCQRQATKNDFLVLETVLQGG